MNSFIPHTEFWKVKRVQNIHGAFNALEGADKLSSNPLASHDYILKIVPTVYEEMNGKQRYSYQYTVANKWEQEQPLLEKWKTKTENPV
ncbi:UNVERIFIED_CONTAM: Endoplasmic reticulum-Golgi intermediate compartment protein 1 [Gekko kuhli]